MPIRAVKIENFKGINAPVRIEFHPITLLFGPNSSGKSTILQALQYAYEVLERNNLDPDKTAIGGRAVDLGGFEAIINNHDMSKSLKIGFDMDLRNEDLPIYSEGYEEIGLFQLSNKHISEIPMRVQDAEIEFSVKWSSQLERPIIDRYSVKINGYNLARIEATSDGKQVYLNSVNPVHPIFTESLSKEEIDSILKNSLSFDDADTDDLDKLGPILPELVQFFRVEGGVAGVSKPIGILTDGEALPIWGKPLEFQGEYWNDIPDVLDKGNLLLCLSALIIGPGDILRQALRKMVYIGPIREIPSRNYAPERSPNKGRWASGLKAWDVLHNADNGLIGRINKWLTDKAALDAGYRIESIKFKEINIDDPVMLFMTEGVGLEETEIIQTRINEIPTHSRITIREESTGIGLMPYDVGTGISQLLPVLVASLMQTEGILSIEQPELHTHPALQVALGDLFVSQVQNKDLKFFLETHSEHLILRFLRRIRETTEGSLPPAKWPLKPDQLSVFYVEQGPEGVIAKQIRIDEDGEFLDRWPKGFFEERERELL